MAVTPAAKEVRLAWDPTRLWTSCHNPVEAQRDATRRAEQLAAIDEELARTAAASGADANSTRPAAGARSTEPRSGGTPAWTASKYLLATSHLDLTSEDVALG